MKYRNKKRISSGLICSLLLLISILSASQVMAKSPVPEVVLDVPGSAPDQAVTLPSGYTFSVEAKDSDDVSGVPYKYRYLLIEAVVDGVTIMSRHQFEQYRDQLVTFDAAAWTGWIDFRLGGDLQPVINTPILDENTYYLIAVQVLDSDGTASMDLSYGESVINFRVASGMFFPQIFMNEPFLGSFNSSRQTDIASGQPLNFWLEASAQEYNGTIDSIRYGWDLNDIDDPDDPGWAIPPTNYDGAVQVPERVFSSGQHILTCRVIDSYGAARTLFWSLNVIPFIAPEYQRPLLFIDQVVDNNSNRWPSADGNIVYDQQQYRDDYWRFLDGGDGVSDFVWERDHRSNTDPISFAEIVEYKSVMVNARAQSSQTMFNQFRPENGQDKYVWLTPYQIQGGNLFMVGDSSMESFLEVRQYMVPLVFYTTEEYYYMNNEIYVVGFGMRNAPDGSYYMRGPRMYPYQTAGLSLLDWSVPLNKNIYGRPITASQDRKASCSGMKAMVLADEFRTNHQIGGWVLSDTLHTHTGIDWRDDADDNLNQEFPFTGDEFVDANISSRTTPWFAQECADGVEGLCLEPMFTGVSRFDWMREKRWAAGDTQWPGSEFSNYDLDNICGEMALEAYELPGGEVPNGTALVNGQTFGYLSYKNVATKPNGKADAYWGFDPYRFNHEESKKSVRWVLQYFGLAMRR